MRMSRYLLSKIVTPTLQFTLHWSHTSGRNGVSLAISFPDLHAQHVRTVVRIARQVAGAAAAAGLSLEAVANEAAAAARAVGSMGVATAVCTLPGAAPSDRSAAPARLARRPAHLRSCTCGTCTRHAGVGSLRLGSLQARGSAVLHMCKYMRACTKAS
jgi:hypothetical protein